MNLKVICGGVTSDLSPGSKVGCGDETDDCPPQPSPKPTTNPRTTTSRIPNTTSRFVKMLKIFFNFRI